jgi:HEAT repeat protein
MLDESDGPVRAAVLEVFGESGDPGAIEVAESILENDSSPSMRATAVRVIGHAGLEHRTRSLARALDDPAPEVRATAVELLPNGAAGHAGELLVRAFKDEDERVWQAAMRHLASLQERDLPLLRSAVRESPEERRDQLVALLEQTSVRHLGLVALDHLASPNPDDRMLGISLARRSGTVEAVQAIVAALVDASPLVRRASAAALADLGSIEGLPALSQALNDPDALVREEAVRALSEIEDERGLDPLIAVLKDPEERVRAMAAEGLIARSSPGVVRRILESLTSPVLRRPVSDLLARMGASAVEPLLTLLREGQLHPDVAATVGETLERLVGRSLFLERLGSLDPAIRFSAVEALGVMGGPESVDGLIRALSDPSEDIRVRSLRLLGDLGDQRAVEAVERRARGDLVPEVVTAAEDALRRLSGS